MTVKNNFPAIRPSLLLDFVNAEKLDPIVTFARNDSTTCATYFDASGTLRTASRNIPRFDYNPSTLAAQGLLIEEARTNSIRNNTMQGAAAGTPGTLPTNWTGNATVDGLSREIVGTGTENGIAYVDVRFSGTSGAAGNSTLLTFEGQTQVAAANGQTWTSSAYLKLAAGTLTNVALFAVGFRYNNSGGTSLTTQNVTLTPTATLTRYTNTFAATDATTAFVNSSLVANFTDSSAVDFTIRIGLPQLEQGAFATSVIPTTTAAVTRADDVASVNTLSPWFNATEGTLFAEAQSPNAATFFMAQTLSNGTVNNEIRQGSQSTGANPSFTVNNGGVTQAAIGVTLAAGTAYKIASAYAANDFSSAVNGTLGTPDTSGTVPTVDRLTLGARGTNTLYLNGYLRRIVYYPRRLSNAELQNLTR